ncbi:hypothetical protein [Novosphingobium sp. MBES04]|uniref:hypothetical protein n=1 Tax=Novosphingobium sp. MBES04 TaxID=1206458 RepID=UPI00057FA019|nr:hypothetical protein [Novosphingobium sp. MBES04]GAM04804.1 hypothetical conserved protein [Novosphingobium sp. MBES04]
MTAPENSAQDNAANPQPLLDLETLVTRPSITIDGQVYDILSPDEISVLDSYRFGIWGQRIKDLFADDNEASEDALTKLVDKVARKVAVGVPDEVFAKLSGAHKMAITDVFTGLLLRNRLGVAGAIARAAGVEANLPTGAMSSPGSSASMAATRSGGWSARLSRMFGRS